MPFCTYCGKPVMLTEKFCGYCGKPISTPQESAAPPVKQKIVSDVKAQDVADSRVSISSTSSFVSSAGKPLPTIETVKMIVPDLLMIYGFGKSDTFNLMITTHRSIFAKLTRNIKELSQKKKKAQIDGAKINPLIKFMAKRIDYSAYLDWYAGKSPQEVLNETPGNYAIDNADIIDVNITDEGWKTEDGKVPGFELVITTREKTLKFKTNLDPENIRNQSIYNAYKN
jgi:uncharacterized membrane protein YvbJ